MERREFIGIAAAGLGALSLGMRGCSSPQAVAPSDWVHLGLIGVGSRGQQLMRSMLRVPGVRFSGLCDTYEPRLAEGRKVTGEDTPTYSDYRKMLESREIDAVMVATPLGLHAEHVVASLDSGRAVYGEKSMGRTLDDCNRIREAARRTIARLEPRKLSTRRAPALFVPEIARGLIGHFTAAIRGSSQYRQSSFLLNSAGRHFTPNGWRTFAESYIKSGNYEAMKQGLMLCFAQAQRAAVIVDTKLIGGALAYRIQFPILQTCQNSQQANTQKMILTALVVRTNDEDHRDGIAIDQLVAEAR